MCCIVDDDPGKQGKYLRGVLVAGTQHDICRLAEEYDIDEIMIAIPSASHGMIQEILDICSRTSCQLKVLPGLYQLVNGEVSVSRLRNVEIEDLLDKGRYPIVKVKIGGNGAGHWVAIMETWDKLYRCMDPLDDSGHLTSLNDHESVAYRMRCVYWAD